MFTFYLRKLCTIPRNQLIERGYRFFIQKISQNVQRCRDSYKCTYLKKENLEIESLIININDIDEDREKILNLADLYSEHYFDLLGSGWVQIKYDMRCCGLEGYIYQEKNNNVYVDENGDWLKNRINESNFAYAKQVWQKIDKDYEPIDWQLDFKSGYRWSEKTWYMNITYGINPGVDIKVPWEISRMQHLVMLARAYRLSNEIKKEKYRQEFRNQILDFISLNPPRYGVNWRCTMDVGIRVANWLMAYNLFKSFGAIFDTDFEIIFASSVYDHGVHIINNLEYTPRFRSNHYLSDIAGLLFAAFHLPNSNETNAWMAFAIQELNSEMEHEFHEDGSNFEGSTSYHRLSTEIILYSSLLCLNITKERRKFLKHYDVNFHKVKPILKKINEQEYTIDDTIIFPHWYWKRLKLALEFTKNILKNNKEVPQFGDNDSGRFFKINPIYEEMTVEAAVEKYENLNHYKNKNLKIYYDENILNHAHLSDIYDVIFFNNKLVKEKNFETELVKRLLGNKVLDLSDNDKEANLKGEGSFKEFVDPLESPLVKKNEYCFHSEKDLIEGLGFYSYAGMGLYIFKSKYLYLAVRCGEVGQNGNGGHCHNDQLAIELRIEEKDIIKDPGTYLYTSVPEKRNKFRSTNAHFTIIKKSRREQNDWLDGKEGLFSIIGDRTDAQVLLLRKNFILMQHSGFDKKVYRCIEILPHKVIIQDYGEEIIENMMIKFYSNGYGKLIVEKE